MFINRITDFAAGSAVATMIAFAPACYQEFTGKSDSFSARITVVISLISAIALSLITRSKPSDDFKHILANVKKEYENYLKKDYEHLKTAFGVLSDNFNEINADGHDMFEKNRKLQKFVDDQIPVLKSFYWLVGSCRRVTNIVWIVEFKQERDKILNDPSEVGSLQENFELKGVPGRFLEMFLEKLPENLRPLAAVVYSRPLPCYVVKDLLEEVGAILLYLARSEAEDAINTGIGCSAMVQRPNRT
jgi:hypothetical protein